MRTKSGSSGAHVATVWLVLLWLGMSGMFWPGTAAGQTRPAPPPQQQQAPPQPPQAPAPANPPAPEAPLQNQPSGEWDKLPRMQLERQFAGPLRDTIIQRLRDPQDGTICYLYLPITAPHSPVLSSGFIQYGANIIGSINCLPQPTARVSAPVSSQRPATRPAPAPGTASPPAAVR